MIHITWFVGYFQGKYAYMTTFTTQRCGKEPLEVDEQPRDFSLFELTGEEVNMAD